MQGISSWIGVICFSSIACSMLEFMISNGKMEKMIRLIFGAFMIISILNPLITTVLNIDLKIDNKNQNYINHIENNIHQQSINIVKKKIKCDYTRRTQKNKY